VWRYLKAAFLVGVDVPALGHLPVNLLGTAAFAILGFVNPAFWLLGAAAEAAVVPSLAFNKRFQNVVDAQHLQLANGDAEDKRKALIASLSPQSRDRLNQLMRKCGRILDISRSTQTDDFYIETNREALENLQWVYLKLLVADHNLRTQLTSDDESSLKRKIVDLEADLKTEEDNESLKQSKSSTLSILKKRLALWHQREQSIDEICSDLTRVEAQVDLLLENASMQGKPQTISTEIQLASDLVGGSLFGDSEATVADLDQKYSKPAVPPQRRQQETN